jgi:hypothetical protein
MYPTPEEKAEKKEQYLQKKLQEQTLVEETRKYNTENLNNWLETNLSNYDPQYQPKRSHSTSFLGDNSEQKLYTKLGKKFKIGSPKMEIDKNQVAYLLDMMEAEEKEERIAKYREEHKLEREKQEKQRDQDEKYRKEKQLKIKEWKKWYNDALKVTLEPRVFKTEVSAKKAQKRDIGKMKKMYFFRYIFDHFYSLSEFSNLSNDVFIHLYRVKLAEDKITQQTQELEKVRKYIEKETLLEEKCLSCGVEYIKYNKLPGKKWTNSKKWNQWLEIDNERKKNLMGEIKEATRNIQWNKLSSDEKKEVIDFHKEWKRLEREKIRSMPSPEPRYRPVRPQNEVIYTDTGHNLFIDPNWSSDRRQEEIENFKQAVRDF